MYDKPLCMYNDLRLSSRQPILWEIPYCRLENSKPVVPKCFKSYLQSSTIIIIKDLLPSQTNHVVTVIIFYSAIMNLPDSNVLTHLITTDIRLLVHEKEARNNQDDSRTTGKQLRGGYRISERGGGGGLANC